MKKWLLKYRPLIVLLVFLAVSIVMLLLLLSSCGLRRTPEIIVRANLRRDFPGRTFELTPSYRTVPVFAIGFDSIGERRVPMWAVHEVDTGARFPVNNGRERDTALRNMVDSLTGRWNDELSAMLYEKLAGLYPSLEIARVGSLQDIAQLRFFDNPNHANCQSSAARNISANSSVRFIYRDGLAGWLLDIPGRNEGFAALAKYDRVQSARLAINFQVIADEGYEINIAEEAQRKRRIISEFVLPVYDLLRNTDTILVIDVTVTYRMQDEQGNRTTLGQFDWGYNTARDAVLTHQRVAALDLSDNFEVVIFSVCDELSLLEAVCYAGHELVGAWGWTQSPTRQYFFYADGTGRFTYGGGRDFIWRILDSGDLLITFEEDILRTRENNITRIAYGPDSRVIPYTIDGSVLELGTSGGRISAGGTSIGVAGSYMRVEWPSCLHGAWAWEVDNSWVTVMNSDGTGSRGFPGETVNFRWLVEAESRNMWKVRDNWQQESWSYEFDGDVLVLTNWYTEYGQRRGQRFMYAFVE